MRHDPADRFLHRSSRSSRDRPGPGSAVARETGRSAARPTVPRCPPALRPVRVGSATGSPPPAAKGAPPMAMARPNASPATSAGRPGSQVSNAATAAGVADCRSAAARHATVTFAGPRLVSTAAPISAQNVQRFQPNRSARHPPAAFPSAAAAARIRSEPDSPSTIQVMRRPHQ